MSGQAHDLIYHLVSIDHYERARQECLDALKENPHDGWVLNQLAFVYRNLGDNEACVRAGVEALNYETPYEQANTFDILGLERESHGEYIQAAEYFQKAIEFQPHRAVFFAHYANTLAHLGRMREARDTMDHAEALEPNNLFVLGTKFNFLYDYTSDRKAQEETLQRMLPLSTEPAHMYYDLARYHLLYNEFQQAYEYAVKSILIDPKYELTRELLRVLARYGYSKENIDEHGNKKRSDPPNHISGSGGKQRHLGRGKGAQATVALRIRQPRAGASKMSILALCIIVAVGCIFLAIFNLGTSEERTMSNFADQINTQRPASPDGNLLLLSDVKVLPNRELDLQFLVSDDLAGDSDKYNQYIQQVKPELVNYVKTTDVFKPMREYDVAFKFIFNGKNDMMLNSILKRSNPNAVMLGYTVTVMPQDYSK